LQLGGSLIDTVTVPVALLGMEVMLPTPPQLTVMLAIIRINNAHTTTLAFSRIGNTLEQSICLSSNWKKRVFPPNHYPDLNWKPCRLLITPSTKPCSASGLRRNFSYMPRGSLLHSTLEMLPHLSMVSLT
jgi:hypothetical protein